MEVKTLIILFNFNSFIILYNFWGFLCKPVNFPFINIFVQEYKSSVIILSNFIIS